MDQQVSSAEQAILFGLQFIVLVFFGFISLIVGFMLIASALAGAAAQMEDVRGWTLGVLGCFFLLCTLLSALGTKKISNEFFVT